MKLLIDTHALILVSRGDAREPWPSPPVAPIGAGNGEGQCTLGDILGLTHPGYKLSPLRGCGDTVERDLGKGKNARGQAFHLVD